MVYVVDICALPANEWKQHTMSAYIILCLLLVLHIVYYIGGSLVVVAFFNRLANFLPRVYANKR